MHESLGAGAASADITPSSALPLAGYGGREGRSKGVHDPIGVRALVLTDGVRTVGIANVDLLNVSRPLVAATRRGLRARGVELDAMTVAATHTHAAPYVPTPALDVHPNLPREYEVDTYVETVANACADALAAAHETQAPAELRVGTAENEAVSENRRANPGWGARIPRGGVDPEVTALSIRPEDAGEIVVYNYPLHPVCTTPGENRVSADWPGYAAARVQERRESVDEVLFLNGASGDINPREKTSVARADDAVYEYMADIGHSVGDSVLAALAEADVTDPVTAGPLHVDRTELRLQVKDPGEPETIREHLGRIETRLTEAADVDDGRETAELDRERRYLIEQLAIAEWDVTHIPATLQYVELGPVGLLTSPAEVLVGLGRRWKDAATVDHLLPVTYADDYVGYVPELRDLENGGYEVETCKISPEAIRRFRDAGVDLVS